MHKSTDRQTYIQIYSSGLLRHIGPSQWSRLSSERPPIPLCWEYWSKHWTEVWWGAAILASTVWPPTDPFQGCWPFTISHHPSLSIPGPSLCTLNSDWGLSYIYCRPHINQYTLYSVNIIISNDYCPIHNHAPSLPDTVYIYIYIILVYSIYICIYMYI